MTSISKVSWVSNEALFDKRYSTQGSAYGTGSLGSRSPGPGNLGPGPRLGLILKSGTGTVTQIQNLRYLGLGPGLKFEKSGTRDWDRDASIQQWNKMIFEATERHCFGTKTTTLLHRLNFFSAKQYTTPFRAKFKFRKIALNTKISFRLSLLRLWQIWLRISFGRFFSAVNEIK